SISWTRISAKAASASRVGVADWSYCQTAPLWFTASRLSRVPLNTVGAAPGRAGDGGGGGRQARTCRFLPLEALAPDRDGVALALGVGNDNIESCSYQHGACPLWGWGRHFCRARETVARSTNTERTRCSGHLLLLKRFKGSMPQ